MLLSKDTSIAAIGVQRVTGLVPAEGKFCYLPFQYYFTKRKLLVEGGSPLAPPSLPDGEPLAINTGY